MNKNIIIMLGMFLVAVFSVSAALNYTINGPVNFFETTSSSVTFNWTAQSDLNTSINSTIYINNTLNKSILCTNGTGCNVTINSGEGFYNWFVVSTEIGSNTTNSSDRWYQVRNIFNVTNFFWGNDTTVVMWLNRNTGDLNISGDFAATGGITFTGNLTITEVDSDIIPTLNATYNIGNLTRLWNLTFTNELVIFSPPAACPAGTYMTRFGGNFSTCVAAVRTTGDNVVGNYNFQGNLTINGTSSRLGIGTTSPDTITHIQFENGTTSTFASGGGQHQYGLKIDNTNTTADTFSQLYLRTGTADMYIRAIYSGTTNNGRIGFFTDNLNDVFEAVTISNSGGLGINTSTPLALLHVNGTTSNANAIFTGGRVGIGTTSPSVTLDVDGSIAINKTSTNQLILPFSNDATTPTLAFGDGNTGVYESQDNQLAFATNGLLRFRIDGALFKGENAGSMQISGAASSRTVPTIIPNRAGATTGVGANSAGEMSMITGALERMRFHKDGNISINGTTLFIDAQTNRVGIGTKTPNAALVVVGNVNITGNLNVSGTINLNRHYGEMYLTGNSTNAFTGAGVHRNITENMTRGLLNGVTFSNGGLVIARTAVYTFMGSASLAGSNNNVYQFGYAVNAITQEKCEQDRKIGTGGDVGVAPVSCLLNLTISDNVTFTMENEDGTGAVTVQHFNLFINEIG